MADFKLAIAFVRAREGGYVNDLADSGGETYAGISRKNNPRWDGWAIVDARKPLTWNHTIEDVTLEGKINDFYENGYWKPLRLDEVKNQNVAGFLFDWAINSGAGVAVKTIQRLVGVIDDGEMGPATVSAINNSDISLFDRLKMSRQAFYRKLVIEHPADKKFLDGWLKRVNDFQLAC
jgi:lysozyme family protein